MQPYLFPYLGYFQLIKAVDTFVIYDDVNYITQGWINRNRILFKGKDHMFTLSLSKASPNKSINKTEIFNDRNNKSGLFELIRQAYLKAPYFKKIAPLIERLIKYEEINLGKYLEHSIRTIAGHLGMDTNIILSSQIEKDVSLKKQYKLIDIAKNLGADEMVNPIGGLKLYNKVDFSDNNIDLYFLKTDTVPYKQFDNEFIPDLSIIDIMMFNSNEEINILLDEYQLI
jgi:hypothetical protein